MLVATEDEKGMKERVIDSESNHRIEDSNLLVISHSYSTFTKGQIDALAKKFNRVTVLVRYNRFTDLSKIIDSDTLKKRGKSSKLANSSPDNVTVICTPLKYLPLDKWYAFLGKQHYRAVRNKIRDQITEFDMIHAHFSWTAGYVGARLKEEYGIPLVTTIHENEDRLSKEISSENSDLYWAWRKADALIRVNKKDTDRLSRFNENVYSIPNGYDRDRLPLFSKEVAREKLDLPQNAKIIFSLGGLVSRKRFDLLIESVSDITYDGELICAIAGQGNQRENLQRMAEDTDKDIRILGYISDSKLSYWMNSCDIFALASRSEGNPTVMFEALGCGKPYVGTNVGGVDEIITTEQYGLLCPPNDRRALTEIIKQGISQNWNRSKILEYAEQFSWERIADQICVVYEDIWDTDRNH